MGIWFGRLLVTTIVVVVIVVGLGGGFAHGLSLQVTGGAISPPLLNGLAGTEGDVLLKGLNDTAYSPDTHMAVLPVSGGLEVYVVVSNRTYRFTGTSMANLEASSPDPVLDRNNFPYDAQYAGISSVVHLPGTPANERLAYYHAEQHCTSTDFAHARVSVGLAVSHTAGKSWTPIGQVIKGNAPKDPCAGFTGAGNPSAVIAGQYVYIYYTDWAPGVDPADEIHVARADMRQAANPQAYQVYGHRSWIAKSQRSTAVISRPSVADSYVGDASVSVNTYLGTLSSPTYLAIVETNLGFKMTTSKDLVNWAPLRFVLPFFQPRNQQHALDDWFSYPTLLGIDPTRSDQYGQSVTSDSNFLYYAAAQVGQPHHLVRRWEPFDMTALPQAVQIDHGQEFQPSAVTSPFAWVCTGDFQISRPDGSELPLYDGVGGHGVMAVLRPGNEVTQITAPWGGYCRPAYPADKDGVADHVLANMLGQGCSNGCSRVRVVEIDSTGKIVSDTRRDASGSLSS